MLIVSSARIKKKVNTVIPHNATNTMYVPKVRLESVSAPMVWCSTKESVWRLNVISNSMLTAEIVPNCRKQKAPTRTVHVEMVSSLIPIQAFVTSISIALKILPAKWNAQRAYTSTKRRPTVYGQHLPTVKDAYLQKIESVKIFFFGHRNRILLIQNRLRTLQRKSPIQVHSNVQIKV